MTDNAAFHNESKLKVNLHIPDKLYFKIGEVAKLIGVEPYVLRYWETEFPQITPVKSKTNQRLYKRHDVETIVAIRELLYDQKFTISGAKRKLKEIQRETRKHSDDSQIALDLDPEESFNQPQSEFQNEVQNIIQEMDDFLKD